MNKEKIDNNTGNNLSRYVLAVDLGSGGPKVALVSDKGEVVAIAEDNIEIIMLPDGGAEQNPDEWWVKTKSAIKEVIKSSFVNVKDIVAISCDSQWCLAVPVNEHGEHLMNAIHWLDTRGGRYNRQITGGFPKVEGYSLLKLIKWIRLTGLVPTHSGVESLGHVLFIKNERPDIYKKTYKFLEPMDYLTSRFTGKITATQKTMAPFMLMDNREWEISDYNKTLLNLTGLEKEKFPKIIPNNGVVGVIDPGVAEELGLDRSTKVVAGISDSNASLIGSGAVKDYEMIIYIGTSLYMTCHIPFKKTDLTHFMTSIPSPFHSRYYLLGEQGAGGKCVEFFLKNFVFPDDKFNTGKKPDNAYELFNEMAKDAPPGSNGLIFLPWLNGSIVPKEDPNVRGGFMNLSLGTDRTHMARAIFEALAFNNRWTMGPAAKFINQPITNFRFSGGGALSDLLSQIHADIMNVKIRQVDDPLNTTVRGAAMLAFNSLGYMSVDEISGLAKIKKEFKPNPSNKRIYDKMYKQYRELFKRNQKIFRALNYNKL
ncbi:MAG: FGGY-family carbohydrate kinase [Desulfobacteraceae bacterium]|nr:FGGY-family carbohydrate kinase [Desulfobacteraceae bacterium]